MRHLRNFLGPILPIILWCLTVTVGASCVLSDWNITFGNKVAAILSANFITLAALQVLAHLPKFLIRLITNTTRINASISLIIAIIGLPAFCLMLSDGLEFTIYVSLISFLVFETVNQVSMIIKHVDWQRLKSIWDTSYFARA